MSRTASLSALTLLLLLCGCTSNPPPQETWLYRMPVGCTDNIWQQEWVVSHDMNFTAYPHDKDAEVFQDYMKSKNVTLLQFAAEPYPLPEELLWCESCSCPRGDIYRILIPPKDIEAAKKTGFSEPPEDLKCEKNDDCTTAQDCCGCGKGGIRRPINKNSKSAWEKQLNCDTPKCPNTPSKYPYCNQTYTPKCQYGECHLN